MIVFRMSLVLTLLITASFSVTSAMPSKQSSSLLQLQRKKVSIKTHRSPLASKTSVKKNPKGRLYKMAVSEKTSGSPLAETPVRQIALSSKAGDPNTFKNAGFGNNPADCPYKSRSQRNDVTFTRLKNGSNANNNSVVGDI